MKARIRRTMNYDLRRDSHWSGGIMKKQVPRWKVTHEFYSGEYQTWDYRDACEMARLIGTRG